ncbi:MAG: tRNA-uridine aminocarboxypropyltransferase [Planctomycetota bacterium]
MKSSPCVFCYQIQENCFCQFISSISTTVPFVLLQHWKEQYRSSNTGRLLPLTIPETPCFTTANWEQLDAFGRCLESYQPYLLYPSEQAVTLSQFQEIRKKSPRPVCIVLLDGTWRQAKRLRQRLNTLSRLPCLRIDPVDPSVYQLRKQAQSHHLSSIEAVIHLMKALSCADPRPLEQLFEILVQRGLRARGILPKSKNAFKSLLVDTDPLDVEESLEFPDSLKFEGAPESAVDS